MRSILSGVWRQNVVAGTILFGHYCLNGLSGVRIVHPSGIEVEDDLVG